MIYIGCTGRGAAHWDTWSCGSITSAGCTAAARLLPGAPAPSPAPHLGQRSWSACLLKKKKMNSSVLTRPWGRQPWHGTVAGPPLVLCPPVCPLHISGSVVPLVPRAFTPSFHEQQRRLSLPLCCPSFPNHSDSGSILMGIHNCCAQHMAKGWRRRCPFWRWYARKEDWPPYTDHRRCGPEDD